MKTIKIRVSKRTTASHEVDPQKGFSPLCPKELPVPDGHNIVNELNRQARFGILRTVSKDVHPSNAIWIANKTIKQFSPLKIKGEKNVDIVWNKHCMSGTEGAELLPGLPPITEYNYVVFKGIEPNLHPYSSCYHDLKKKLSTGLIEYYEYYGIRTIIIGGLALDYCVMDTILDLANLYYNIIVNLSATRSIGNVEETIKKIKGDDHNECIRFIDSTKNLELI